MKRVHKAFREDKLDPVDMSAVYALAMGELAIQKGQPCLRPARRQGTRR